MLTRTILLSKVLALLPLVLFAIKPHRAHSSIAIDKGSGRDAANNQRSTLRNSESRNHEDVDFDFDVDLIYGYAAINNEDANARKAEDTDTLDEHLDFSYTDIDTHKDDDVFRGDDYYDIAYETYGDGDGDGDDDENNNNKMIRELMRDNTTVQDLIDHTAMTTYSKGEWMLFFGILGLLPVVMGILFAITYRSV